MLACHPELDSGSYYYKMLKPIRRGEQHDNDQLYCYDSTEVARIAEIILENDMLKENEMIFIQKDSLCNINRIILEGKICSLGEIIRLKDEQLFKMEKTPLQMTGKSWKWWQYTLAAIGAVTFGFTAGIVYENIK